MEALLETSANDGKFNAEALANVEFGHEEDKQPDAMYIRKEPSLPPPLPEPDPLNRTLTISIDAGRSIFSNLFMEVLIPSHASLETPLVKSLSDKNCSPEEKPVTKPI